MKNLVKIFSLAFLILSLNSGCKNKDQEECVCTEIYAPVCGSNGEVYSNSCYAACAGVTYTAGFCTLEANATIVNDGDIALDGCGWLIQFEVDGSIRSHQSDDLPNNFQQDNLQVSIKYKPTSEVFTCGLNATEIPKIKIETIE
ncbi:MAG: Kazal-type serine protease inhibitor [Bacteroidota bacterium]